MRTLFKYLLALIIISAFFGMVYREAVIRQYPVLVRHYQGIMEDITSPEYIEKMVEYMGFAERPRMHYATILQWLGENLEYPTTLSKNNALEDFREENENHEDPIEILEFGYGRCGEFVIVYTALCFANGWETRMVLDFNDHMWVEIYAYPPTIEEWNIGRDWMHIEVTDGAVWCRRNPDKNPIDCPKINDPTLYAKKDLGEWVWAIQAKRAERVDDFYKEMQQL